MKSRKASHTKVRGLFWLSIVLVNIQQININKLQIFTAQY